MKACREINEVFSFHVDEEDSLTMELTRGEETEPGTAKITSQNSVPRDHIIPGGKPNGLSDSDTPSTKMCFLI
ncbi:hypothetical protein OWV82_009780 [Melia azedarach]|uniref:Uncharacterized protein n=1 Tax=Melia azedarach TaxID=155640 RepID=A0ACC1Y4I6_MELAZ|nr:hypothetical protein OWV82_009780 [Melia azedarach]